MCTSGNPNTVANPRFVLTDVPEGTKFLRFKLVDTNVRDFNHGGGVVAYTGQDVIEPGAFKYKSPCPPDGVASIRFKQSFPLSIALLDRQHGLCLWRSNAHQGGGIALWCLLVACQDVVMLGLLGTDHVLTSL